jgi:hypothetical protein
MTVLGAKCFETADFGGNIAYGATMTEWGADYLKLHLFPPGSGFGAPAIYPEKIKSLPMLTLGGKLCNAITSDIATICGCVAASNYQDNSRAAAAKAGAVTCIYGDANVGGFTTTGCVGTRLTVTGTTNELVDFALSMFGLTTTQTACTAGAVVDTEFFPFELGANTFGANTLLGFTLNFDTGLIPVFAMDGLGPTDGYGEVGDVGAGCTLQVTLANNAAALTEWGKYEALTAVTPTITLTGTAASTWAIALKGYYTAWESAEVTGLGAHRATITGHVVGTSMLNIT